MEPDIHSTYVSIIGEREGLVQHTDESNRTGSNCKVETNTWVVVLAVAFYLCGNGVDSFFQVNRSHVTGKID